MGDMAYKDQVLETLAKKLGGDCADTGFCPQTGDRSLRFDFENAGDAERFNIEATEIIAKQKKAKEEHEVWLEKLKVERAGPHAQRARQLAGQFLQQIEAEGFDGYAIIGIPNEVIRGSLFEAHQPENCEWCHEEADGGLCEDAHEALTQDRCHDHVFVFKTAGVGESDDWFSLAWELSDEGKASVCNLLDDAETVPPSPEITVRVTTDVEKLWRCAEMRRKCPEHLGQLPPTAGK